MEKTIIMSVQDDKLKLSVTPNLDVTTAYRMLGTLTKHLLDAFYSVAEHDIDSSSTLTPDEKKASKTGTKEALYDAMNTIMSNTLNQFYPDNTRASIEDEAILKCANELILERYNALTPEEQAAYSKGYTKLSKRLGAVIKDSKNQALGKRDTTTDNNVKSTRS